MFTAVAVRSPHCRLAAAALGSAATAAAMSYTGGAPGVYHQQVDVVFVWPQVKASENSFQYGGSNLVRTAGIIGRIVGTAEAGAQPASDSATLVGMGVTRGYSIRLPNTGGQYALDFGRPVLDVQVVGRSPGEVAATMRSITARIDEALLTQQVSLGVTERLMVRTSATPANPPMEYSHGSRIRTLAMTLLLGLGLTTAATVGLGRWATRREARAHREPISGAVLERV